MKIKLLAKIEKYASHYHISTQADPRLAVVDTNKQEAIARLAEYFNNHLDKTLGKWISYWKNMGSENICNCPQGYIELPIDLWKCKYNKSTCILQAQVDMSNKDRFFRGCTATKEQKEGIYSAIKDGKYDGFHHVAGRNLCVMCEATKNTNVYYRYHYEIEMQFVKDLISEKEEVFVRDISKSRFPDTVKYCAVCTDCALEVLANLYPNDLLNFQKIEIDYYER